MQYRPEIDGLRALAVVPVVLFHAGFSVFSGGFAGVDVFFVISGYLITSILVGELNKGGFSLVGFYERRARRILPALFFVLALCLPAAWILLPPLEMKSFAQSLFSVPVFASNLLFWKTSGYFETTTELKPLLHTWSLAVEEQYYLIFPLLLMATWKIGKRKVSWLLIGLGITSLLSAQLLLARNPSSAFYLLQARGWELLIGAWVAINGEFLRKNIDQRMGSALALTGLALILGTIIVLDKRAPFPGLLALFPTAGAALVILFARSNNITGILLSSKIAVSIGLVSYSAYLWHQPLFSFARIWSISHPGKLTLAAMSVVSFVLAYFTWRFVEKPFRNPVKINRKSIFVFSTVGSLCFVALGGLGHLQNGFANRLSGAQVSFLAHFENSRKDWEYFTAAGIPQKFRFQCDFYDIDAYRQNTPNRVPRASIADECFKRDPSASKVLMVWGDSHAQQLAPGLNKTLPSGWQLLQVASSGCTPAVHDSPSPRDFCEHSNWFALDSIAKTKPDVVIVSQNLGHNIEKMQRIIQSLKALEIKQVVFTGPSPHWALDLPKIVGHRLWDDVPRKTFIGVDRDVMRLDQQLKNDFPSTAQFHYVSIIDDMCDVRGCDVYLGDDVKNGITSWDYGHLTPIASETFVRRRLMKEIVSII